MKIFFTYQREHVDFHGNEYGPPIGTDCTVVMDDGTELHGAAWCHDDDQPNKAYGRKLALKRAIAKLPKKQRVLIWMHYWEKFKR